jgi:hypothetical protein
MRKLVLAGAAMLLLAGCAKNQEAATGTEMKPGEWEVKIDFASIEGDGIPEAAKAAIKEQIGKGMTSKSCLTKADAEKPGAGMFGSPEGSNCTFAKFERSDGKISVDMTCKPAGMTLKSKMDGSFGAEQYSMKMEQTMEGLPTGPVTMKGMITGRRLGECPA